MCGALWYPLRICSAAILFWMNWWSNWTWIIKENVLIRSVSVYVFKLQYNIISHFFFLKPHKKCNLLLWKKSFLQLHIFPKRAISTLLKVSTLLLANPLIRCHGTNIFPCEVFRLRVNISSHGFWNHPFTFTSDYWVIFPLTSRMGHAYDQLIYENKTRKRKISILWNSLEAESNVKKKGEENERKEKEN